MSLNLKPETLNPQRARAAPEASVKLACHGSKQIKGERKGKGGRGRGRGQRSVEGGRGRAEGGPGPGGVERGTEPGGLWEAPKLYLNRVASPCYEDLAD